MSWTKTGKGFSKRSPKEAIADFWKFWPTVATEIAASIIDQGVKPELVEAISEAVNAIDHALDWEFGPGRVSKHHLCLSGKGDPVLRRLTEQWLASAPAADETWEYYASRQPHRREGMVLEIAKAPDAPETGHRVALDELVCAVTEDSSYEHLDLVLFHPVFTEMKDEELRAKIVFIGLDTLLGEDDVERWTGAIEIVDAAPRAAIRLRDLPARIEQFKKKCTGDRWSVLEGQRDGKPLLVSLNTALKRIDHLLLDMHVEIRIRLRAPNASGLPTNNAELEKWEEELLAALGEHGAYVGRETHDGFRIMHIHVMEGGPAAAIVDAWRARHPDSPMEIEICSDPQWEVLERWD